MFENKLKALESEALGRRIRDRQAGIIPETGLLSRELSHIFFSDGSYINFSSNDYLGLAGAASVTDAAVAAMTEFGFGSGASRLLAGGTSYHGRLEEAAAAFKETEAALVFNSGYVANMSALPSIAGEGDVIFSDELNHASLIDACRLSRARTYIYRHRDTSHLKELMNSAGGAKKIVVTDTVFSMDGDIAPLKEIAALCGGGKALLYLDDAHGTGVLGNGRGALAHFGVQASPWIIQMGTFSKAFGSYGAFVAGSEDTVRWLINTARGLIYSTALPACVAAASLKALQLVQSVPHAAKLIGRLWQNRERLFSGLHSLGLDTLHSETPIIPIVVGDVKKTMDLSNALLQHRIYCPAIRPPTVALPRLRVTVTAAHNEDDIDTLLRTLEEFL